MRTNAFDYLLPPERIAQRPAEPRDAARLLVVDRQRPGHFEHRLFRDLPELLATGDLIVANDTRVVPARLRGRKASGGAIEVLLLRSLDSVTWEALVRGRVRVGSELVFEAGHHGPLLATVVALKNEGVRVIRFAHPPDEIIEQSGEIPLPPYINQPPESLDRYQTVYARVAGSVAAPTAGLHFTPELIARLGAAGIGFAFVTLHVGLDTFQPLRSEHVEEHTMHTEWYCVPEATVKAILATRQAGGRVVAVGTTTVRALETAASEAQEGPIRAMAGWTGLYIRPGHRFRVVDVLITNFHSPRSTLLVLVSAFAGHELMVSAYRTALETGYRFLSFGDAMLIR